MNRSPWFYLAVNQNTVCKYKCPLYMNLKQTNKKPRTKTNSFVFGVKDTPSKGKTCDRNKVRFLLYCHLQ